MISETSPASAGGVDRRITYVFGPFRFNPSEYRLEREGGSPTRLTGKARDLLFFLVKNPQRLIPREEIFSAVWQRAVEDNVLTVQVKNLREVMGDTAKKSKYLETLPGRGIRFCLEVREEWTDAEVQAKRRLVPTPPHSTVSATPGDIGEWIADLAGEWHAVWETTAHHELNVNHEVMARPTCCGSRVSQGSQSRSFNYDSLGRLVSARNPETGAIGYSYDYNSNLLSKTDGRNIVTCFGPVSGSQCNALATYGSSNSYDGLNRPRSKAYTDGVTPTVTYGYGQDWGGGQTNYPKGRLTSVSAGSTTTYYNLFDADGRVTEQTQTTNSTPYTFYYQYAVGGPMDKVTYPSGRVINMTFDGAGRVATVAGSAETYAGGTAQNPNIQYMPNGAIRQMKLGNGLYETWTYNTRFQPSAIALGTAFGDGSVRQLQLGYGANAAENNGNLLSQQISGAGLAAAVSQSYAYDGRNRVLSFAEGSASQSYTIDNYGNMTYSSTALGSWPSASGFDGNNRNAPNTACPITDNLSGWRYDCAGNLIRDSANGTYAFDAENRQIGYCPNQANPTQCTGTWASGNAAYVYDGDGRRVQATLPNGPATTYVYDIQGELAAEYVTAGAAPATDCMTCYIMVDALGSTRLVTNESGVPQEAHDYLPFGTEMPSSVGNRSGPYAAVSDVKQQFTGKERDSETGLDYFGARYLSSAQGRFTSVDPENRGGKVPDPQSWNGYAYGRNNPLLYTDPTGETYQICVTNDQGKNQCSSVSDDQFAQIQQNPGSGISLSNGNINAFVNGQWVNAGTYTQTDVDLPPGVGMALHAAGATADAEIKKFARDVAIGVSTGLVAGVVIGAAAEGIEALPRVLPFKNTDLIQRVSRALTRIGQGAKMYSRDGIPFQNREGLLPGQGPGYYTEYTVEPAAGGAGRGAERLVLGKGGEVYYTPNHYGSFVRIQ